MTSTVSFNVEKYTLITGCVTTFCNGFIFQIISVWRAKKFILLLQKLEEYDSQYPQKSRKRRYNAFTIYNVLFGIFVIVFPIFVVFSLWIKHFFPPKLVDGKVQMTPPVIHWEAVGPTVGMMSLCLMILEVATIYPIIQIGYFIKAIEYRMQEILEMIDTHVRPRTPQQYDLLFNIYKTGAWTGKSLEGTPNKMASRQISSPSQEFWKRLNHRYLDLLGVLDAFMQFAGLFFIVIFPLQIISSVCMFYCISAADIVMWCAVDNAVHLLLLLGLIKLWALCNAGHRMEKTHSLILRESLKVDADEIQDYNERTEVEEFYIFIFIGWPQEIIVLWGTSQIQEIVRVKKWNVEYSKISKQWFSRVLSKAFFCIQYNECVCLRVR